MEKKPLESDLSGSPLPKGAVTKAKKVKRFLKHFAISIVFLLAFEIGLGYYLISTRWTLYVTNEQMAKFAVEMEKEAQPLPENFYRVYTTLYPRHLQASMTEQIFLNYFYRFIFRHSHFDSKPHCYCDMIYDIQRKENDELYDIPWDGRLQEIEYGFGIEEYSSSEKCFNYSMNKRIAELKRSLNPELYGNLIYTDVKDLSDDEVIELIMLLKNGYKFNRFKNSDTFNKVLEEGKARLKKNHQSR
ncbi:MAG TPA: hypothetical protein VL443_12955 [Cyclobacteriaceae bacterium]|nr:hypothetical protein [Cyclobacteriaceae bacterium]